jgi:riboflavin kinase/FMN adenylyltransferase
VFDGVHVGHQAVIARAVEAARAAGGAAAVLTFDPHPIRVLAPDRAPRRLLASVGHKQAILGGLGVEWLVVVRFDRDFAAVAADGFLAGLVAAAPRLRLVAVGEDWRFGRGRTGDVVLLRETGRRAGFEVAAVPPVMMDGERVSSTRIRQAIRDGNLDAAARMLGRRYAVAGRVVAGRRLGRTLGFPTMNLDVENEQLPPDGVWVVTVRLRGESHPGIANLGRRPTTGGTERTLEAHVFEFDGDLYGEWIEVEFRRFVRPERRFESLAALQDQIARDVEFARSAPPEEPRG